METNSRPETSFPSANGSLTEKEVGDSREAAPLSPAPVHNDDKEFLTDNEKQYLTEEQMSTLNEKFSPNLTKLEIVLLKLERKVKKILFILDTLSSSETSDLFSIVTNIKETVREELYNLYETTGFLIKLFSISVRVKERLREKALKTQIIKILSKHLNKCKPSFLFTPKECKNYVDDVINFIKQYLYEIIKYYFSEAIKDYEQSTVDEITSQINKLQTAINVLVTDQSKGGKSKRKHVRIRSRRNRYGRNTKRNKK